MDKVSFTKEPLHVNDIVVFLRNERTGSSTSRKCKFVGQIIRFTDKKVRIEKLSNSDEFVTPSECKNYGRVNVLPDDIICVLWRDHN